MPDKKNPYPLMRLIARNSGGTPIATNDIVLPVSDEMDCRACHASGTQAAAQPAAGWVWSDQPERDFRLNILRLHDENQFAQHSDLYVSALAARGFNPQGPLSRRGGGRQTGALRRLSRLRGAGHGQLQQHSAADRLGPRQARHRAGSRSRHHARQFRAIAPPATAVIPAPTTKCLRGAMGGAIAPDGSMDMQCQSCHGNMSAVGSATGVGLVRWNPTARAATPAPPRSNNGQIRYTSCFRHQRHGRACRGEPDLRHHSRTRPAPGISLYRFSAGHGGLQCSACHGSTHAEFPATHRNDNVRNETIQGHAGVMVECTACHTSMSVSSTTASGGPHGMHPVGSQLGEGSSRFHRRSCELPGRVTVRIIAARRSRGAGEPCHQRQPRRHHRQISRCIRAPRLAATIATTARLRAVANTCAAPGVANSCKQTR